MEDELLQAKSMYASNLADIEEALGTDPDNAELRQVQEELRTALETTNAALQEIISTKSGQLNDAPIDHPHPAHQHPPRIYNNNHAITTTTATNNNARIHPRSLYSTSEPDFATLAQSYPSLQPFLLPIKKSKQTQQPQDPHSNINNTTNTNIDTTLNMPPPFFPPKERTMTIDFKNPAACRELTKVLLKSDFGVNWDLPEGHLVPPVTNRLNYILWIEDLLKLSSPSPSQNTIDSKNNQIIIKGLDIGCGASCIYPLLGASSLHWHFVGVDVTSEAIEWAQKNVDMNTHLKNMIEIRKVEMQPEQKKFFAGTGESEKSFGEGEEDKDGHSKTKKKKGILAMAFNSNEEEQCAFSMCNPPFFEKMDQASANPSTAFGGTAAESVYPGGEEAFVRNMFEDSLLLKDRVHWFTTMVGKKVTLKAVRKWLHAEPSVHVVRTTEFFQGQTSRWGIAWSFVADASVALKPIDRGEVVLSASSGVGGAKKRGAEEDAQRLPPLPSPPTQQKQQQVVKKRKISGRSVSIHIALNDPHAALQLLNQIKTSLEKENTARRPVRCSIDISQYQLTAEPCKSSSDGVAVGFTVQLLAQQAKRYVLTITLLKSAGSMSSGAMAWFSGIVAEIEGVAINYGAQIIP